MSTHLRIYDIPLAANGGLIEDIAGSMFFILSAQGPFQVRTQDGLQLDLVPSQGVENLSFQRLEFLDKSGATNIIRIAAGGLPNQVTGRERFIDKRTVAVEPGRDRTLAGKAFCAATSQAAVAAQYSRLMLFNPATNSNNVIVESIRMTAGAGMSVGMQILAGGGGVSPVSGSNKLSNNGGSAAQAKSDTTASVGGVSIASIIGYSYLPALQTVVYEMKSPIIIRPNSILLVWADLVNTSLTGSFDWFEA